MKAVTVTMRLVMPPSAVGRAQTVVLTLQLLFLLLFLLLLSLFLVGLVLERLQSQYDFAWKGSLGLTVRLLVRLSHTDYVAFLC
jgi:hypothetical protein